MSNISAPSASNTIPDTTQYVLNQLGREYSKAPLITANRFLQLFLLLTPKRLRLSLVNPLDTRGMNNEEVLLPVLSPGFLPWRWLAGEPKAPCPPTRLLPPSLIYVEQQQPTGLPHQLGRGAMRT